MAIELLIALTAVVGFLFWCLLSDETRRRNNRETTPIERPAIERPTTIATGIEEVAGDLASVRASLERLNALLDLQQRQLTGLESLPQRLQDPPAAGVLAAQRLRTMRRARI